MSLTASIVWANTRARSLRRSPWLGNEKFPCRPRQHTKARNTRVKGSRSRRPKKIWEQLSECLENQERVPKTYRCADDETAVMLGSLALGPSEILRLKLAIFCWVTFGSVTIRDSMPATVADIVSLDLTSRVMNAQSHSTM